MQHTARLALHPSGGTVEIDGQDVSHAVRSIELTQTVGSPPQFTIDLNVHEVEMHGVADIRLPHEVQDLLVALGWTPPGTTPLTADTIREPGNRSAALTVLRLAARFDPSWLREQLRYQARVEGRQAPDLH
ncbi:hypothetical protein [Streptomyces erythrochromogenes]|uniref:hypothetical protein n=1 Tax=Streptomyces erythrochromogenes TaxID=285574 RepID=UPI0036CD9F5F